MSIAATEAHDDDGLPHTLEHLIFLGSELYPFKGVLDLLANRCLASGTNAWTDTDHTCYTVKTVGKNGFLNLLPIYLDHVLYPTLSVSFFVHFSVRFHSINIINIIWSAFNSLCRFEYGIYNFFSEFAIHRLHVVIETQVFEFKYSFSIYITDVNMVKFMYVLLLLFQTMTHDESTARIVIPCRLIQYICN